MSGEQPAWGLGERDWVLSGDCTTTVLVEGNNFRLSTGANSMEVKDSIVQVSASTNGSQGTAFSVPQSGEKSTVPTDWDY